MTKMLKIFMLLMPILMAACAHHVLPESGDRHKAEMQESYPIIGISFAEFESLLNDIKDQIPPNARILSIGPAKHSSVVHVITGRIDGPLSGGGLRLVFEKKENRWRLVEESVWIS